ncbi:hypothetical protein AB664_01340 [Brucella anthropi]|uniref:Uncharacterized protein n=1 Tax=Brucella anthropi TaxID=529 RepID=A0A656Z7F8_BRUAN|nr:hypothetical protein AB664_01340 [Brucella anthropi]
MLRHVTTKQLAHALWHAVEEVVETGRKRSLINRHQVARCIGRKANLRMVKNLPRTHPAVMELHPGRVVRRLKGADQRQPLNDALRIVSWGPFVLMSETCQ